MKKKCSKCGITKIANTQNFHKKKDSSDGFYPSCRVCKNIIDKERYEKNKETIKQRVSQRRKDNPELLKEENRKGYQKHRTKRLKQCKLYSQRPEVKERRKQRYQERMETDVLYRLRRIVRSRFHKVFQHKPQKSRDIIGCNYTHLKEHLEKQFTEKMSWENQNTYWEIDHIIPLASAADEKTLLKLCHYSNLQPLEISKNRAKGAKLDYYTSLPDE